MSSILNYRGLTFTVRTERDDTHGPPWEENDGHGKVTGWEPHDAGLDPARYRLLNSDYHSARYYDFEESIRIAVRDKWGLNAAEHAKLKAERLDGGEPTPEGITHRAVLLDYQYLKGWCQDEWWYVGVTVTLQGTDITESLWGIESNADSYIAEVAEELAESIIGNADTLLTGELARLQQLQAAVRAAKGTKVVPDA
jgi:hypothetical protein